MKQTAVDWLVDKLEIFATEEEMNVIEQAKEMEKEQKIEFANNYGFDICGYDYERAEQYYKETFKSE
jgi:hypothetical protein